MMDRRIFLTTVAALLAAPLAVEGQPTGRVYRIGYLGTSAPPGLIEPFRTGLRELGWIEGQNVRMEYRVTDGTDDRLPELAADLVRLRVDVIVAYATPAAQAAKNATAEIPIVLLGVADPVGSGLVTSLARPGGNVTGVTFAGPDTSGKRLELLREMLPKVKRVSALRQPGYDQGGRMLSETEVAAKVLGVKIQLVEAHTPQELEPAFSAMTREGAGG